MVCSNSLGAEISARSFEMCIVAALFLASGCGQSVSTDGQVPVFPVFGKVTFEGQPLVRAVVTLTPINLPQGTPANLPPGTKKQKKAEVPATGGVTDDDGEFELSTYAAGDGAPEGEFFVTISCEDRTGKRSGGEYPELLPEKYQNPTISGLKVTIREGENEFLELNLVK